LSPGVRLKGAALLPGEGKEILRRKLVYPFLEKITGRGSASVNPSSIPEEEEVTFKTVDVRKKGMANLKVLLWIEVFSEKTL